MSKWNLKCVNFWKWLFLFFFTEHNCLEIHLSCGMINSPFLCISCVISHHLDVQYCVKWFILCRTFRFCYSFGLLHIKMLWMFIYKFLCECTFSCLWHKCPGVQSPGHKTVAWLVWFCFLRNLQTVFPSVCTISHLHQQCLSDSVSWELCQNFGVVNMFYFIFHHFILALLRYMKNCTHLMYTFWWVWICIDTITRINVINIDITSRRFIVSH